MTTVNQVVTKTVTLPGGLPAFVAAPENMGKVPVIVLVHERYGLVKHTTDLATRFAWDGYACIAPDCFYKHPDQVLLHEGGSRYDMTDPESVEYIAAAIDYAKQIPQIDAEKVAVMGVCQTGRHPLVIAAERPISAALVWYGAASPREWEVTKIYPKPLEEIIAKVDCPILGVFGEADHIISLDDVRKFRSVLESKGKTFEINIYRGAPHGWLNDTMPGRYRRAQAEAAWADQLIFLDEVFAGGFEDTTTKVQRYNAEVGADYDFKKNVRLE
jgi:carboxymethylenebutenolidase